MIYALKQKDTEDIASVLVERGRAAGVADMKERVGYYHAGKMLHKFWRCSTSLRDA